MSEFKNNLSHSEENYLKAIFHLSGKNRLKVSTNSLAEKLDAKASSITDMLKKLSDKGLISYKKYKGCELSAEGEQIALQVIRKHRLWETFLVNKLNFGWDQVHDVAEQLEHIHSAQLIDSIDHFLNYPKFDPHGDPIPDKNGVINYQEAKILLSESAVNSVVTFVSVNEDSFALLKYLDQINLKLGSEIKVLERIAFDESLLIEMENKKQLNISKKVAENIGVRLKHKIKD
jgi:DtxR family Mn-dependent transcriptional regulator